MMKNAGTAIIAAGPPLAVRFGTAAGVMACLGVLALARGAASGSLVDSAVGALLGGAASWQGLRMVKGRLGTKAIGEKDADRGDLESQNMHVSAGPILGIIPLNGMPSPNG